MGMGQRMKPKKERAVNPEDVTQWGNHSFLINPICPKGLELADLDNVVDLHDLEVFKTKIQKEIEFMNHLKFEEFDKYLTGQLANLKIQINEIIGNAEESLRQQVQKVIDIDIKNLDDLTKSRQDNLKVQIEANIYQVEQGLLLRFMD